MGVQDLNRGETREIFWNAPEFFKDHFADILGLVHLGPPFLLFAFWGATRSAWWCTTPVTSLATTTCTRKRATSSMPCRE
jgi:hypothetical protein